MTLWRVVIIENYIEEFTEIGLKRKWIVRQASYDPEYASRVEKEREEA